MLSQLGFSNSFIRELGSITLWTTSCLTVSEMYFALCYDSAHLVHSSFQTDRLVILLLMSELYMLLFLLVQVSWLHGKYRCYAQANRLHRHLSHLQLKISAVPELYVFDDVPTLGFEITGFWSCKVSQYVLGEKQSRGHMS